MDCGFTLICDHGSGLQGDPRRVGALRLVWFVVKKEKTHFVTKVVCDWMSARGQYLKKDGGKILDRKNKPTGCQ